MRRIVMTTCLMVSLLASLLVPARLYQEVRAANSCVNPGGTGGCFASIQAAINDAGTVEGDTITVAANNPLVPAYNEPSLTVNKSLTLVGTGPSTTVIEQSYGYINVSSGKTVTVSGMTFHGSNGTKNAGTLTLSDCAFDLDVGFEGGISMMNCAFGAGLYNTSAGTLVTVTNGVVTGGVGAYNTGAITLIGTTVSNTAVSNYSTGAMTLTDSTINGAIYNADGPLTLTNTTVNGYISNNGNPNTHLAGPLVLTNTTVNGIGIIGGTSVVSGGIYNATGGIATVTNSRVRYSQTHGTPGITPQTGRGGGIYNVGNMTVKGSTLDHNSADQGGGIYNAGTLTLIGSTSDHNVASDNYTIHGGGGGLYNDIGGTVTLINSTHNANTTGGSIGGGILNLGTMKVLNATISGNSVPSGSQGGGVANYASLTLANTIVAGNTATGGGPDVTGAVVSRGHNLIGNTTGGSGFVGSDLRNVNPQLLPLANNGGPTQTMALPSTSPAAGGGDPAICAAAPPNGAGGVDQRGVARSASHCSIGSYESTVTPLPPAKPTAPAGGSPTALPAPRPTVPGPGAGTPTPDPLPPPRP